MSRRLHKKNLLLALALLMPGAATAQQSGSLVSVSGIVFSEGQHQRIEHVTIRLCDNGGTMLDEAITTDSGEFTFKGLQRVAYILTFDAMGYEYYEMRVDLSFMSDRGMSIYLRPTKKEKASGAPGNSVSAHELSMPEKARNLVETGKKKLYGDKKPEAGLQDFQQAVSIAPDYYEAYCEIAMAYLTLGKKEEAANSFKKSIEISHDTYGDAEVGIGTMLVEQGNAQEGEQALRKGVQLNPSSWMGYYEIGKLEFSRNQMEPALEAAQHAKSLAPSAPVVYRLLANIHMKQQNYPALLEDIDAYIKLDPDSPAAERAKQMREQIAQQVAKQSQSTPATSKP